jgi:hypothetical protein
VTTEPATTIVDPSSLLLSFTFRLDLAGMGRSLHGGGSKFRPWAATGTGMGVGAAVSVWRPGMAALPRPID